MGLNIESVEKACRSVGGIRSIVFFEDNGFLQWPEIGTGLRVFQPITFVGTPAIFTIYFRYGRGLLDEEKKTDPAGDFYETSLSFFTPKNRYEMKKIIHRLTNNDIHAIVTDSNGFRTLVRDLRHKSNFSSGDRLGSANGFRMTFEKRSSDPNPEYLPDIIDVPDGFCEGGLISLDGAQLISLEGDCLIQLNL